MEKSLFFIEFKLDNEWHIDYSSEHSFFWSAQEALNYLYSFNEDYQDYEDVRISEYKRT